MRKIPTIFDRNWEGDGNITTEYFQGITPETFEGALATEKIDGTNVRLTIRNHTVVRVEKRRNPSKLEKAKGLIDPWYTDASESAEDKHIMSSVRGRDYSDTPDGEWSAEAVGPNIQGNPLNLEKNTVVIFSIGEAPIFENVPTSYEGLKEWLPKQKSLYGNNCGIEGIVWHCRDDSMMKIKTKDFK